MDINKIETINCKVCSDPMPKLRKELYGYDFCIKCSNVLPKVGRVITYGQGDDTWNDLEIMDQDTAKKIIELEQQNSSAKFEDLDLLDYNQDNQETPGYKYKVIGAVSEIVNKFEVDPIPDHSITYVDDDELLDFYEEPEEDAEESDEDLDN